MVILSEGPNSGINFSDDSIVGTIAWTNPGNAAASDNSRASAIIDTGEISHYLKATGFGFSIPNSAKIVGIEFKVERGSTVPGNGDFIEDNSIRLVKNGIISGNNKASGDTWPAGFEGIKTYGSNSDLWGLTWTPTDINSFLEFGAVVSAKHGGTGTSTALIDHVTLTVYYFIERRALMTMTQTL